MEISILSKFNLGSSVYVVVDGERETVCSECGEMHTTDGKAVVAGEIDGIDFSYLHTQDSEPYKRVIYLVKTDEGTFVRKGESVFKSKSKAEASIN
jgi:hypothetical protein